VLKDLCNNGDVKFIFSKEYTPDFYENYVQCMDIICISGHHDMILPMYGEIHRTLMFFAAIELPVDENLKSIIHASSLYSEHSKVLKTHFYNLAYHFIASQKDYDFSAEATALLTNAISAYTALKEE